MSSGIQARYTVSPYFTAVMIHAMLFGIGYLNMAVKPIQLAGQDVWIAVLLCSLGIHIVIAMMYRILNRHETDLLDIHRRFFGRWIGGLLNLLFAGYFLLLTTYQIRLFVEVVQVWIFPDMTTWALALALLLLACYTVAGGFRTIVGICAFSLFNTILYMTLIFIAPFFHFNNLLPVMDHSSSDIFRAVKELTVSYMGIGLLFFCYPFIKTPRQSQKWAHWGNLSITVLFIVEVVFDLMLFKPAQLSLEIWPGLAKYKFVQFPFIERFEFIGTSATILRLLPVVCLCLWVSSRIVKHTFSVRQVTALPVLSAIVFIATGWIPARIVVDAVQTWIRLFGISILCGYVPLLFLFDLVRTKAGKQA